MTSFAISVDTDEARTYAARCLGLVWVEWQEGASHAYAVARGLPQAGVWLVEVPSTLHLDMGTSLTVSAPDDDLWGGPIVLECFAP